MIYSLVGSIGSVGILMKCTKAVGYQPIMPKQGQTCRGSKNSHQDVYICIQKSNLKIKIDRSY